MMKILFGGLVGLVSLAAAAEGGNSLGLTPADLERLGVVLQPPREVTEIEIASGLAQVAVPPAQEAIVSSTVGGVLSRMRVAEGDYVAAGQALAEIMSSDLLELQREYLDAALAADLARGQLERDRRLYADGIIAERRVLESTASERAAATTFDQLAQQLELAGMSRSELARLVETRALDPTLALKAPFAGFVMEQLSALGARVDALDPVYRVADLSELWLELRVPQERSERIEPGMRVVASVAERRIDAEVRSVGRVADSASQTVLIRARIAGDGTANDRAAAGNAANGGPANGVAVSGGASGSPSSASRTLRVGQLVPARVLASGEGRLALAVPSVAVVRVDGRAYVFGRRNGDVEAVPVEILAEDGVDTYVRSDLDSGVEVVVGGVAALKSIWASAQDEGE